jgi:Xaa-Pro dipeptidase
MLNQERLKRVMEASEAEQVLVTDPASIYYLIGRWFMPGERFLGLLCRKEEAPVLYLNTLFRTDEDFGIRVVYYSDTEDAVAYVQKDVNPQKMLGVDKILPAKFLLEMIDRKIASAFVNGSLAVDLTRARKDSRERELMRAASHVNDLAMERFPGLIHDGITEKEAADQLLGIYLSLGAEGYSFEPIVAFGDNAADPHHEPDDTVIQEGDAVLFDVGCKVNHYCSDMTRTFFYKKAPSPEAEKVYNLVLQANLEAEKMCRPGVEICTIDQKARDIITAGGYGRDFTHRLGHFIGLETHEYGDVSAANHDVERPGYTHSIEPGIYHPGTAGVRIEDLVLITEDGCEVLNHYPKEIQVIG